MNNKLANTAAALFLVAAASAQAGPGHDHSHDAPAVSAGKASPRFEALSDLFEVVGVMAKGELSITVDRFKTNAPVLNASVELESGAVKVIAKFFPDRGDYRMAAMPFEKPGTYPINLTLRAGDEIDILAGNLVVPETDAAHSHTHLVWPWKRWIALGAALIVVFVAAWLFVRRRATRSNHV